jgi:hypothetical protein
MKLILPMISCSIKTVRDLVARFGGTGKFAEFLSVVPSAVSNMLSQNRIPPGYHLEIYLECERRDWSIDRVTLFGLEQDQRPLRRKNQKQPSKREARVA